MIHKLLVGILNILTFQCSGPRDFVGGKCFRSVEENLDLRMTNWLNGRFEQKQSNTQRHANRYVHTARPYLSSVLRMPLINSCSCAHCKKCNPSHSLDASHVPMRLDKLSLLLIFVFSFLPSFLSPREWNVGMLDCLVLPHHMHFQWWG